MDGNQPPWLPAESMFDTQEECCNFHYEWKQDCMASATPITTGGIASDTILTTTVPPTKVPTRNPTHQPSRLPTTDEPTDNPESMPETKRPTRYPTPQPSRHPIPQTKRPTRYPTANVMLNSPTSPYQMIQTEPTIVAVQRPNPTKEPTDKPQKRIKPRPTSRPTRANSFSGESPMAASFLGSPTSSFEILTPSEASIVQYPSKGKEQIGNSIQNQIQQQTATKKTKKKKGQKGKKKGKKKKAKKSSKLERSVKSEKRQKKNQKRQKQNE